MIAPLDAYRWLISPEAAEWLVLAASDSGLGLGLSRRLRKSLTAEQAGMVLEQVDLRHRARAKFTAAAQMFFTRVGLEQASDQAVAAYKAARFPRNVSLADLCCGIGGDLLALAGRGPAIGVDRDPAAALLAEANLRAAGWGDAGDRRVETADVTSFPLAEVAAWHLDPDRRPQGKRTTRVETHEPGIEAIESLLRRSPDAAIKLAPACDLPPAWRARAELEWISRGGQCRQLVAWFGRLARYPGCRGAAILGNSLDESRPARLVLGTEAFDLPLAPRIGRYVFEPDPAVLAAGLSGVLAADHGLARIGPIAGYLTGDRPALDAALHSFEVVEVLPFDLKRLRALLRQRGIGQLEIKKRGIAEEPQEIRRRLQLHGNARAVLLVAPTSDGVVAILARRLGACGQVLLGT